MNHPIQFVSLGPGDPELVTIKALKALRKAEIIYCPATQTQRGHISRAATILRALEIREEVIHLFPLPMSKERKDALLAYDQLFKEASASFAQGKRTVIVAEGDAGFYSSIQYVYDVCKQAEIPVERLAGVPAFIAAGSMAGLHIVKQEEELCVMPGTASLEEIAEKIEKGKILVLMKLSSCQDAVQASLRQYANRANFHYFENVGTDNEYYTSDTKLLQKKAFPYFSLMIIQPKMAIK